MLAVAEFKSNIRLGGAGYLTYSEVETNYQSVDVVITFKTV